MKRIWIVLLLLSPAAALAILLGPPSFGLDPASGKERLIISGSSTVAPLVAEMARRFEEQNPHIRVDVQSGGSSRGLADLRRGLADLAMVSRHLKEGEEDLQAFGIARDGLALIVHRNNPVGQLDADQIRAVYRKEITDWRPLGGPAAPITVVTKAEGRATLELFLSHFELRSPEIRGDVIVGENEHGIKTVAGNVHALGYVSIGAAEFNIRQGVPIRLLPLEGVEASIENVRNGSFPLARTLLLVGLGSAQEVRRSFLEFARSAEVHELILEQSFVPPER